MKYLLSSIFGEVRAAVQTATVKCNERVSGVFAAYVDGVGWEDERVRTGRRESWEASRG